MLLISVRACRGEKDGVVYKGMRGNSSVLKTVMMRGVTLKKQKRTGIP